MATVTSKQFSLGKMDWLKSLIIGVGTPVIYVIQELIPKWPLGPIEKAALSALLIYLLKNFFTPTQITMIPATKEEAAAVKSGEAEVIVQTK